MPWRLMSVILGCGWVMGSGLNVGFLLLSVSVGPPALTDAGGSHWRPTGARRIHQSSSYR